MRRLLQPRKEKDTLIIEVRHTGKDREAAEEEFDDAQVHEQQVRVLREGPYNIEKERDSLFVEIEHMGTDIEATGLEVDDTALQKERLSAVTEDLQRRK
jgi:hypothetical protein